MARIRTHRHRRHRLEAFSLSLLAKIMPVCAHCQRPSVPAPSPRWCRSYKRPRRLGLPQVNEVALRVPPRCKVAPSYVYDRDGVEHESLPAQEGGENLGGMGAPTGSDSTSLFMAGGCNYLSRRNNQFVYCSMVSHRRRTCRLLDSESISTSQGGMSI